MYAESAQILSYNSLGHDTGRIVLVYDFVDDNIIQVAGIGRSNSISASVVADALGLTGRTILKLDHLTKKDHLTVK